MPIVELFSKRLEKAEKRGTPDVFQYEDIPNKLRIQIIHILRGAAGRYRGPDYEGYFCNQFWNTINSAISREKGLWRLGTFGDFSEKQCVDYFCNAKTLDALDVIQFSFQLLDGSGRNLTDDDKQYSCIEQAPDDAITELNHRFLENGVGYEFTNGKIVRIDSQFIHKEVVMPAISLLNEAKFKGASDEFLKAHEYHRKGESKDSIAWALKAFESTMKAICDERGWRYEKTDTAKPLLDKLFQNGLIPKDLEAHFGGLRAAMESGLPNISNSTSRHGQGKDVKEIPPYMAAYALHLAAANIVFLVETHKAKK
jgi:hypothetical protein